MEFFSDNGADTLKPSLFELLAQEQLRDLLQPALKYVLGVFAHRYPRYLLRIVNRHEEYYGLIMFIVEHHYLKRHNASFSENFYGLKRRRRSFFGTDRANNLAGGSLAEDALENRERWGSLLFLIGVPYFRAKAQDYFEQVGGSVSDVLMEEMDTEQVRAQTDQSFRRQFRRRYRIIYPYINTAYELYLLLWNIAYLFDRTPSYRPWLSWIGVDIRRLGIEDFRAANSTIRKMEKFRPQPSFQTLVLRFILTSPRLLLDSLRLLLPTTIFFIKFLEWWCSPGSPARSLFSPTEGPVMPPPRMLLPHPRGTLFNKSMYGICPLCSKSINNATALPSGYVFCYRCAYAQVQKHEKCPVTLLPAKVWQLRKVLI